MGERLAWTRTVHRIDSPTGAVITRKRQSRATDQNRPQAFGLHLTKRERVPRADRIRRASHPAQIFLPAKVRPADTRKQRLYALFGGSVFIQQAIEDQQAMFIGLVQTVPEHP